MRAMEILFISAMVFWTAVTTAVIVLCRHLHNARRQPDGQAEEGAPDIRDEGRVMNERQANRAFALARRIWQANSRPAFQLGRRPVSFHWCTAVMAFIYLIVAGALVWGERRWVDTCS